MNNYARTTIEMVREFHQVFDHPISTVELIPEKSRTDFRINFLEEEVKETIDALREGNNKEVIDGIADIQYVLDGFILESGISEFISEERKNHSSQASIKDIDIDIDFLNIILGHIKSELVELRSICHNQQLDLFKYTISAIQCCVDDFIYCTEITEVFTGIVEKVHLSNMSKTCKTQLEAEQTIEHVSKTEGECYYKQVGEYWIVYRMKDNKVMKSVNYKKPDLSEFVSLIKI